MALNARRFCDTRRSFSISVSLPLHPSLLPSLSSQLSSLSICVVLLPTGAPASVRLGSSVYVDCISVDLWPC